MTSDQYFESMLNSSPTDTPVNVERNETTTKEDIFEVVGGGSDKNDCF